MVSSVQLGRKSYRKHVNARPLVLWQDLETNLQPCQMNEYVCVFPLLIDPACFQRVHDLSLLVVGILRHVRLPDLTGNLVHFS